MLQKSFKFFEIQAAILDMDGVITQTAKVHKNAWRDMFDEFFKEKGYQDQQSMTDDDYLNYIDGKPRYDGVKSFLGARNISLPYGDSADKPSYESICGLGNRKNDLFRELLSTAGVETFAPAIEKIKKWKHEGIKVAVVTSSKNCKLVLDTAGITSLFDAIVDGIVAKELQLNGKPDPGIFLQAAKMLEVEPKQAVVFEDAISGVQAGAKGNFAYTMGVSRNGEYTRFYENGADVVIESFNNIDLTKEKGEKRHFEQKVPMVFSKLDDFYDFFLDKKPVVFLDYDGTLTPIVSQPEDAVLSEEMRNILSELSERHKAAVVSGRDMDDVKSLVNIDTMYYAGSHGFRISGPGGLKMELDEAQKFLPMLDDIENELIVELENVIEGVKIDRKRYAVAIHYRNAPADSIDTVFKKADEILKKYKDFKKGTGKKIIEIKPGIDWHKGKAIFWIMNALEVEDKSNYIPIYIGDDVTDEDAFKAIADEGIGVLVGEHEMPTAAKCKLADVEEVKHLLLSLAKTY